MGPVTQDGTTWISVKPDGGCHKKRKQRSNRTAGILYPSWGRTRITGLDEAGYPKWGRTCITGVDETGYLRKDRTRSGLDRILAAGGD